MTWLRVTVEADVSDEEPIADILAAATGTGVEILDSRAVLLVPEVRDLPPGRILLRAYLESDRSDSLVLNLSEFPSATVSDAEPLDEDWQERWKDFFHATRVSEHFIVRPPWESLDDPPEPGVIEIVIEPGMAFGTGTHETTRLCIRTLDGLVEPGTSVLDVGCGSGILSIAAAQLGARRVLGIDIDVPSIEAATANALTNRVADRVEVSMTPLADIPGTFDLVIANILSSILVTIRDGLIAHTAVGGRLILSGILAEEADDVIGRFEAGGMTLVERVSEEAWACLHMTRPAATEGDERP